MRRATERKIDAFMVSAVYHTQPIAVRLIAVAIIHQLNEPRTGPGYNLYIKLNPPLSIADVVTGAVQWRPYFLRRSKSHTSKLLLVFHHYYRKEKLIRIELGI